MDRHCIKLIFQYSNIKRLRNLIRIVRQNLRKMNRRQKLALVLLLLLSRRRRQRNLRRAPQLIGPPRKLRRIQRRPDNVESDSGSSTSSYDSSHSSSSASSFDGQLGWNGSVNTTNGNDTSNNHNESISNSDLKQEDVDPDLAELVAFDMNQDMGEIKPENDVHGDQQELRGHGVITLMSKPSAVKKEEDP